MAVVAVDRFAGLYAGIPDPAWPVGKGVAVTPSDTDDLVNVSRGLYIGGAGNVKVDLFEQDASGGTPTRTTVTFTALAVGVIHPLRVSRVYSTLTTATGIVAVE